MATIISWARSSLGHGLEEVVKAGEAYSDGFRILEPHALARDETGDGSEHREAMIPVRGHSPTLRAGGNPPHPEAIVTRGDTDAKAFQGSCHAFDAIRFLRAQLLCAFDPALPVGHAR